MSRCDSAAIVPNTRLDLPDPLTPVNTVRRRFGISTLMFFRLFSRAPCTRMSSWLSAAWRAVGMHRGYPAPPTRPRVEERRAATRLETDHHGVMLCPCGSGLDYAGCCEPLHGGAPAPSPEA